MEPKVFEEFMHVYILFKDEDAPTISASMLLHQELKCLKIDIADVVHSSVYLAYVYSENSEFVSIHRILKKSQIDLHFEFCMQHNANMD